MLLPLKTPLAAFLLVVTPALLALPASAEEMNKDDFRNYCGYYLGLDQKVSKRCKKGDACKRVSALKGDRAQMKSIGKMLGTSWKKLKASVAKGRAVGATCDEVGKVYEERAHSALKKALPGRVAVFVLDYSDPEFVVASVTWKGGNKGKLEEEAALVAKIVSVRAPITKTIAVRAVNPRAKDISAPSAVWFDGKINPERAARIDTKRIATDADRRYIPLFDAVVKIDERSSKMLKFDARRRSWTDAPADALTPKGSSKKG
ncbi:MAG: hypothetical protein GY822_18045 [Deltaproteobacteria bacterium]|nr:hypothetical protein [Deltaproteobacteria bacterium]